MMQVNSVDSHQLPQQRIENSCKSFFKRYFNTKSLITAILFSAPLYLSSFGENFFLQLIISIISIVAIYSFLNIKQSYFQTGFFMGIFWFWWVGLSFRYYDLTWMIPIIILGLGIGYGLIFWGIDKIFNIFKFKILNFEISKILWGVFLIFGFDYLRPFTFDWLKPEVLLANSFFTPYKTTLSLIVLSAFFFKAKRPGFILLLLIALILPKPSLTLPPLKIKLVTTYVPQDKKWLPSYIPKEIKDNFKYINDAIKEHYDVVVLPESAFPLFLNTNEKLMQKLINLSQKITIITGALHLKNKKYYNSTYVFENKKVTILDKHVLVPFGEYIPLPFFQEEINKIFFGGASDYKTSSHFGIFTIKKKKFINAICYEATIEDLYKLNPKYIIALSNDAWFMPSIQPVLQKLLIKTYAYKFKKVVFHSINGYQSYVVK